MKSVITLAMCAIPAMAAAAEAVCDSVLTPLCYLEENQYTPVLDPCFTIPGHGLFTCAGDGRFRSLDAERNPDFEEFMRLDDLYFDQPLAFGDVMLTRSGHEVYRLDETPQCVAEFDTGAFRIFPGFTDDYLAVLYDDGGSVLYSMPLDTDNEAPLEVTRTSGHIFRAVPSASGELIIGCDSTLYEWDGERLTGYLTLNEPITDFALTQRGTLILTAGEAVLYDGEKAEAVAAGPMRQVLHDRGRTYIVLKNGHVFYSDSL